MRAVGTNDQRRERRAERNHADLTVEAPGARETGSVPWPLLLQQRMSARVEATVSAFEDLGAYESNAIDVRDLAPAQLVDRIRAEWERGRFDLQRAEPDGS